MSEQRRERIIYYGFAAFLGVFLLLNWLGAFEIFRSQCRLAALGGDGAYPIKGPESNTVVGSAE